MSIKEMTKEELEVLSYTDLTYMLIKENKKTMNTPTIFKKICDLLGYSDEEYAAKIGDYYTSLTIDKRFILLDNAEWDISDNHKIEMVIDDDEEDTEESEEIEDEIEEEVVEDSMDDELNSIDSSDDDLDDVDDDLDDLSIMDDEEPEEE